MLPRDGRYDAGTYISYEYDKYVWNSQGMCVFDFKNNFGGIDNLLIEIDPNSTVGKICALNFYFKCEYCGFGCPGRDRELYMFTYLNYVTVERRE